MPRISRAARVARWPTMMPAIISLPPSHFKAFLYAHPVMMPRGSRLSARLTFELSFILLFRRASEFHATFADIIYAALYSHFSDASRAVLMMAYLTLNAFLMACQAWLGVMPQDSLRHSNA